MNDIAANILETLKVLFQPGATVELRIPKAEHGALSGYFSDMPLLAEAVAKYDGKVPGVYVTLNTVNPDLLARGVVNRLRTGAQACTSDKDILQRRWLPLDFDPVRLSDTSSTDAEHAAALDKAREVQEWLTAQGWPDPVESDPGNGGHLIYKIDLPNDPEHRGLIEKCLKALDFMFSDDTVKVDTGVANAARIWKLYGTMACKGADLPERPHRRSRIIKVPENMTPVNRDLLEKLAATLPEAPKSKAVGSDIDVEQWIHEHNIKISKTKSWNGGKVYELEACPWNPEHRRTAHIIQFPNGGVDAGCFHASCAGQTWPSLRDKLEPEWRENQPEKDFDPFEFLKKPDPGVNDETEWVVPGFITSGAYTFISGYPKSGKSWLALRLACQASTGGSIFDGFAEMKPTKVLYVVGDTSRKQPMGRLRVTGWDYNLENLNFVYQHDLIKAEKEIDLTTDQGKRTFEELIKAANAKMVFLDTLTSLTGIDIQEGKVVKPLSLFLNQLSARLNIALVVLYHNRKPRKSEENIPISQFDISGSGNFMRLASLAIGTEIVNDKKSSEARHMVRWLAGWNRSFPCFTFALNDLVDDNDRERVEMTFDLNPTGRNQKQVVWEKIQSAFGDVEFTRKELNGQLPSEISESYLKRLIFELVQSGKLRMTGNTKNAHYSILDGVDKKVANQPKSALYSDNDLHTQLATTPQKVANYPPECVNPKNEEKLISYSGEQLATNPNGPCANHLPMVKPNSDGLATIPHTIENPILPQALPLPDTPKTIAHDGQALPPGDYVLETFDLSFERFIRTCPISDDDLVVKSDLYDAYRNSQASGSGCLSKRYFELKVSQRFDGKATGEGFFWMGIGLPPVPIPQAKEALTI
ncbi:MAG: AAA family ATPase [Candidatus Atribacteria bacterium]|nr:AAA family ATPase [Candidatus Atribacteria bacterium]